MEVILGNFLRYAYKFKYQKLTLMKEVYNPYNFSMI